jgi:hypothetical protein
VAEAAPTTPGGQDAASGSGIVLALGDLRLDTSKNRLC